MYILYMFITKNMETHKYIYYLGLHVSILMINSCFNDAIFNCLVQKKTMHSTCAQYIHTCMCVMIIQCIQESIIRSIIDNNSLLCYSLWTPGAYHGHMPLDYYTLATIYSASTVSSRPSFSAISFREMREYDKEMIFIPVLMTL